MVTGSIGEDQAEEVILSKAPHLGLIMNLILKRIFIVDDEETIAWTMSEILRRKGYATHFFADPREALEAAEEEPPHLLISDVYMPAMNGIDFAQQLKLLCPECKVILMSGNADGAIALRNEGVWAGHFDVMKKPISVEQLFNKVEERMHNTTSETLAENTDGPAV